MNKQNGLISKNLIIGIISLFIFMSITPSLAVDNVKKSSTPIFNGNTLYVGGSGPGNYTHIQDAIDNASNGDTVFVYNKTYYENVVINKSINLIGEDRNSTIIDGGGSGDVITITNDNTLLKNFTIQNGGYYNPFYALVKITSNSNTISNNTVIHAFHGIWLDNSDLNNVSGNYITLSKYGGICLKDNSEYNIIKKNIIYDAGAGGGIQFEGSNNNTIIDNFVSNTQTGMQIGDSSINTIENNTFFNNSLGLYLTNSYNNLFNYNTIETNNDYGVFIYDSNNNVIYHNNFINNSHNALDYGNNIWDDGYPSGGNFWDDYTGEDNDGDGIGDTPYSIPGNNNEDRYPLMYPLNNSPPNAPIIDGPNSGRPGVKYTYCINLSDPDNDSIYVLWNWGDGTNSGWLGPYITGEEICVSHTWIKKGTYKISVTVKDQFGASATAYLEVTMPRTRILYNTLFLRFLERFPNAFPLLKYVLESIGKYDV